MGIYTIIFTSQYFLFGNQHGFDSSITLETCELCFIIEIIKLIPIIKQCYCSLSS